MIFSPNPPYKNAKTGTSILIFFALGECAYFPRFEYLLISAQITMQGE
jgi:hypothetical protein